MDDKTLSESLSDISTSFKEASDQYDQKAEEFGRAFHMKTNYMPSTSLPSVFTKGTSWKRDLIDMFSMILSALILIAILLVWTVGILISITAW